MTRLREALELIRVLQLEGNFVLTNKWVRIW